jgi:(E)-4-hydroxy-3-methylbut-2-enyl-diphosphate synthase
MKSSDAAVMIKATLTLTSMMIKEGFSYPLHLGVTEAGEGEDGRIRSAAGIGALLAEGIGDTIRVSLSENPENEIPAAREILKAVAGEKGRVAYPEGNLNFKVRSNRYRPEVYTLENEKFINESGIASEIKVVSFHPPEKPVVSKEYEDRFIIHGHFSEDDPEKLAIIASATMGKFFITRRAEGICISNSGLLKGEKLIALSFSILQSTEARITRVTYLSCPTCGRTKFDLQDAVRKVKEKTGHLSGLKIAIMGCIVNGPGEMAGADYGYVGAANGKVHIYRGTTPVKKNVPYDLAAEELLKIIESNMNST